MIGIYKIVYSNDRVYIGQSNNISKRFLHYKTGKCKGQIRLFNSFQKYGVNNHTFEIIEECKIEDLNDRERYWQEYYNVLSKNGLNCVYVNTQLKRSVVSAETLKKMKSSRKHKPLSKEHRLNISLSWKNRVVTEETKRKMSLATKGIKKSDIHKQNISKGRMGIKFSEETKLKMSKPKSFEHILELRKINNKPVLQYDQLGIFIKEWSSISEAGRALFVAPTNISLCCRNHRKTCAKYVWKFKT